MKIVPLFILALLHLIPLEFGAAHSYHFTKVVDTLSGPVQGFLSHVNQGPVEVFLGIPFAEPPVRNLRFLKPKPVKSWTKTLNATKLPPACVQYTAYPFPWADALPGNSEDCLYLNIFVPFVAKNESNFAVLFWIHGGGFTFGSNRLEAYDARALAVYGNVVVVTINYRLGLFGFLTSNTEDAPGNVGLYDTVMALQWVNDNIESFGGDKKRITLFGQSAGGIAVSLLCVSPLTKGLFSKAILQSGTGFFLRNNQLEPNMALSQRIAEAVGCATQSKTIKNDPETIVGCLRNKTASYLAVVLWSLNPTSSRSFFPQFGDDLLPRNFVEEILSGNFHNVPLLIGNNRDEGSFQIATFQPEVFGFFGEKNAFINRTDAENRIRRIFRSFSDPERYVNHYLGSVLNYERSDIRRQVYTASGDSSLLCTTVYFAESYAARRNDVYFNLFTHRPSNTVWAPWMGVAHADDTQFLFGRPIRRPHLYHPVEVALSKKMIRAWTNFAKNGNPSESSEWPKYSRENPIFVHVDTNFDGNSYGIGPHLENCQVMREDFET